MLKAATAEALADLRQDAAALCARHDGLHHLSLHLPHAAYQT